jgi:hypothetical protein
LRDRERKKKRDSERERERGMSQKMTRKLIFIHFSEFLLFQPKWLQTRVSFFCLLNAAAALLLYKKCDDNSFLSKNIKTLAVAEDAQGE